MAALDQGVAPGQDAAALWKRRYEELLQKHQQLQVKCDELGAYFLEVTCDCGGVNLVPWSTQGNKTDTKKRKCTHCHKFSISVPYQCIRCCVVKNSKDGGCDKSFARNPSRACGCCEVDLQRKTGGARNNASPELMSLLCVEHVNDSPPGADIQALVDKIGNRIPKESSLPPMQGPCVRCVWKSSETSSSGDSRSLLELYILKNQIPPPCRRMWAGTIHGVYYEICTHCWAALSHKRRSGTELRKIWSCCRIIGSRFEKVGAGGGAGGGGAAEEAAADGSHEWKVVDPATELQRLYRLRDARGQGDMAVLGDSVGDDEEEAPAGMDRSLSMYVPPGLASGAAGNDLDGSGDARSPASASAAVVAAYQSQQMPILSPPGAAGIYQGQVSHQALLPQPHQNQQQHHFQEHQQGHQHEPQLRQPPHHHPHHQQPSQQRQDAHHLSQPPSGDYDSLLAPGLERPQSSLSAMFLSHPQMSHGSSASNLDPGHDPHLSQQAHAHPHHDYSNHGHHGNPSHHIVHHHALHADPHQLHQHHHHRRPSQELQDAAFQFAGVQAASPGSAEGSSFQAHHLAAAIHRQHHHPRDNHHHHHHAPQGVSASPNVDEPLRLGRERSFLASFLKDEAHGAAPPPPLGMKQEDGHGHHHNHHPHHHHGHHQGDMGQQPMSVSGMSFSFSGWADSLDLADNPLDPK